MSQDRAQGHYAGRSVGGGRYQLRDLLGEGGMASVHLAYDSVLDRQVAVKTLHTELGREPAFRERFRREAQSVAKLTHTNIVSVYDTGEDELNGSTTPYIVMEYVEGRPLGSLLEADVKQFGAMSTDDALKITADVLAALEISHEMGLVHRDIKPGNVMMTKRGVTKVMDFGIARAMQSGVTSMTQTGMVVGTPQYLSPEQALGRGVDARSDLYSVGIMLFQLVTGRLPFEADSALAIAYAHVQENAVAPSSINRSVPPAVDALVARALRKNPNERFPSAEAMRDECLRVAQSLQQVAPSIVPGAPTASGAGVGSAVFPPVDRSAAPAPGPVQSPYQPGPYGPPTPSPAQPAQPHRAGPGYGYPQQGYGTPAPGPAVGYGVTQQAPAPYAVGPQQGSRGPGGKRKRNTVAVVVGVFLALGVLGGIINSFGGNGEDEPDAGSSPAASAPKVAEGYRGPDTTKAIEATECSEPETSYTDEGKVEMPNFVMKHIDSVKKCLQAGGWRFDTTDVNENTYGDGAVMKQFPQAGTDFDPDNPPTVQLDVSTGNPAQ
ncbi:protein kinase [Streptomyces sp. NPDC005955]|uniref:protein kinase domain-containing protein n=1 Tax=Streptomyces sp. NPDC005955 TaxID=3364738 RepID=UPI003673B3D1